MALCKKFYLELVALPPLGLIADDDVVPPRPCSWSRSERDVKGYKMVVSAHQEDHGSAVTEDTAVPGGRRRHVAGVLTCPARLTPWPHPAETLTMGPAPVNLS